MPDPQFQPGDLLAFHGFGWQSAVINAFSWGWPFRRPAGWAGISHVGIVGSHPDDTSGVALYESTTGSELPCLYAGWPVSGVQCHPIADRLAEYEGLVWHYPLAVERSEFNEEAAQSFLWRACSRPYDWHGCLNARSTPIGWLSRQLCRHDPDAAYVCWELDAGAINAGMGKSALDPMVSPNRGLRRARRLGLVGAGRRLK